LQCGYCCMCFGGMYCHHFQGQNEWCGCLHIYCIACRTVAR
jgi:hypothetical protein